jgi:hypothetical protein
MKRNTQAIERLENLSVITDKSASSYWRNSLEGFNFNNGEVVSKFLPEGYDPGRNVLKLLFHFLFGFIFRVRFLKGPYASRLFSEAQKIFVKRNSVMTLGALRQVITLAYVDSKIKLDSIRFPKLVIGDGFGILASLLHLVYLNSRGNKTIVVNLTQNLLVDAYFILSSFEKIEIALVENYSDLEAAIQDDTIDIILLRADDISFLKNIQIGIAFNISSMQEMDYSVISEYFDLLRNSEALFYCSNRLSKTLQNGDEIEFMLYPWNNMDEIYIDEQVPWQKYFYTIKPPFYHKYDGAHHHRLVKFNKSIN